MIATEKHAEGYFKNLYYHFLKGHNAYLLFLKENLYEEAFSCVKTKRIYQESGTQDPNVGAGPRTLRWDPKVEP